MRTFLKSNETIYRLGRTILQGVIGVIIANLDVLIGTFSIPVEYKPFITALVMAVLSPIMSELGGKEPAMPGEVETMGRGEDYELQEDEETDTE